MDSIISRVLASFQNANYTIYEGGWVRGAGDSCVRIRESLVCMGATAVIKVDIIPPLVRPMRFESNGCMVDAHVLGVVRCGDKTYSNAYLSIAESGIERVVVVFESIDDALIRDEIVPLVDRVLGSE